MHIWRWRGVRPELVIFDCDGVLVDSERLSHKVLQQMLAERGAVLSMEAMYERFMGSSLARCLELVGQSIGAPVPADFLPQFNTRCVEAFEQSLAPVPGVEQVLATLRLPHCVASNGPHEKMRFTLAHTGLLPRFAGRIFSAEDVPRPKPAPDVFLHAAAMLGAAATGCVVVEDSATGVAAARAAGMRVLGFAAMGQAAQLLTAGAHEVFADMSELPALLG